MSSEFVFSIATPDDALGISNLYQEIYEGTYPDPMMKDLRLLKAVLASHDYCWTIARLNGQIVASTIYRFDKINRLAKAYGAVVSPICRGHGITQKLLIFGYQKMRAFKTPVEVIYATTRTVSYEPQQLTENLGYKKLGVFPNVHKTDAYETHCLAASFSQEALEKRVSDFKLHPKLFPLFEIVQKECALPSLTSANLQAAAKPHAGHSHSMLALEPIQAARFVRHRFLDEQKTMDEHEWFYPFQDPNLIMTSPEQGVEVFAYFSELDKHCVLIGVRDSESCGIANIIAASTKTMKALGARYIEFLVRADETEKIQAAFDSQYIPSAYFPAMQLSHGKRYDFVVFSRSFEILDFHDAHLKDVNLEYLQTYFRYWQEVALDPVLKKHAAKKS